ncbi:MAG: sulfite exporter TauE/SafE family protein [Bauldia sp.]|nr:sulfite exporter TauE/SafE family protein [Bauldia sp.]
MISDPWFYAAAIPAMVILGLSKGGFTTMGMLSVPIMALAISPVQAAGVVLPILVLSDIVALASYRRAFDSMTLKIMLPAAVVGIGIGWATAAWVTEHQIRLIVGLVSVLFAVNYWFRDRLKTEAHGQSIAKGGFWGVLTGFTSFVSHSGGPPYQMYTVPLRLEPRIYAGTSVVLFAAINAIKLIPYFFLGQFDAANLTTSALLLPVSIPATFLGVWLVRKFETDAFYKWIYASIFIVGVYLIVEAVSEII